ncbi:MAG: flagellar biosynthetic protein FliO [Magnetococcus sp. YQC-5]
MRSWDITHPLHLLWPGVIILLVTATAAWATPENPPSAPVDLIGEGVRVVGYLLLLMVVGAVAIRMGRKYAPQLGGNGPIRIEDGRNFAPGVGVRLIRVGSRAWLLGVSKDHIALLAELGPEDLLPGPKNMEQDTSL